MFTQQLKERDAIPAPLYPISLNGASGTTGVIDMSKYNRCEVVFMIGAAVANANVRGYLQQTNNSDGSSPSLITGSNSATIANTSNRSFTIECQAAQLTARYVIGVVNVETAAAVVSALPIGTEGRFPPVTSGDANTVAERLVVPVT